MMRMRPIMWQQLAAIALAGVLLSTAGCDTVPNTSLRQRGTVAAARGDHAHAEVNFAQAVKQDPTDWRAQIGLGESLMKQARWFEAQIVLERALILRGSNPETPGIVDQIAESLFRQRKVEELNTFLAQSIEAYGTTRDYLRQGNYLAKVGDADGARVAYRKAVEFAAPDDAQPYLALVAFYELIGDRDSALMALRRAYAITPDDKHVNNRLRQYGLVPGPTVGLPADKYQLP